MRSCGSPVQLAGQEQGEAEPPVAPATTGALTFCGELCREHAGIAYTLLPFCFSVDDLKKENC